MSRKFLGLGAAVIALGAGVALLPRALTSEALAQGQAGFTADQANAGHGVYATSCGGCHRANLAGGGDAPALGGSGFMSSFGNRSTKDLYQFIAKSMPAGAPGSLSEDQYTTVTAYLLWANGAKPGTTLLTKDSDVKISTIATGKILPEAIAAPTLGKEAAMIARAARENAPPPLGQTVMGTVKNYVDITDEMLTHPPDGEWLMYRRNYAGWSF